MNKLLLTSLVGAAVIASAGSVSAQLADTSWAKVHGDIRNSGCTDIVAHGGKLAWSNSYGGGYGGSGVAVGKDGTLYAEVIGGLVAVSPDGKKKWSFDGGPGTGTPTIGSDGTIYYGSAVPYGETSKMYAINPDGTLKWSLGVSRQVYGSSATIDSHGFLYFGTASGDFYAVNASTGRTIWMHNVGSDCTSPAILPDGTVVVAGTFNLYAFNPNGVQKWCRPIEQSSFGSAAVGLDGTSYIGSVIDDGPLLAIDSKGNIKWSVKVGAMNSAPAVTDDGRIYAITNDHALRAFNTAGESLWTYHMPNIIGDIYFGSPVVDGSGMIYYTGYEESYNTCLIAVNRNGQEQWRVRMTYSEIGTPSIGPNGEIYVGGAGLSCVVPEPSCVAMLLCGLGGISGSIWRKKRRA